MMINQKKWLGSRSSPCSPKLASDAARRHNIGLGVLDFIVAMGLPKKVRNPTVDSLSVSGYHVL